MRALEIVLDEQTLKELDDIWPGTWRACPRGLCLVTVWDGVARLQSIKPR